jgi:hypothetical protein
MRDPAHHGRLKMVCWNFCLCKLSYLDFSPCHNMGGTTVSKFTQDPLIIEIILKSNHQHRHWAAEKSVTGGYTVREGVDQVAVLIPMIHHSSHSMAIGKFPWHNWLVLCFVCVLTGKTTKCSSKIIGFYQLLFECISLRLQQQDKDIFTPDQQVVILKMV